MVFITVKLPPHLWKRVKRASGANGIKLYEFVRFALERELIRVNNLKRLGLKQGGKHAR